MSHHQGERGVGGDVEWHAEEQIRASLIELAAQFPVLDEKLKQGVTGREGHEIQLARVPGAHDEPSAIGVAPDLIDEAIDLVDGASVGSSPIAPLGAVDPTEVALGVGPFV